MSVRAEECVGRDHGPHGNGSGTWLGIDPYGNNGNNNSDHPDMSNEAARLQARLDELDLQLASIERIKKLTTEMRAASAARAAATFERARHGLLADDPTKHLDA